ncbi:MAG: hypothetical protein RMJ56_09705 [Gemmataceae bacterium]|nr:hypothetical protein [Gemmata sp.]MDW8197864.1 hypothetical protein [Gemmataceae bacterium]
MPKVSVTLIAVLLLAGLVYLAYHPTVAQQAVHWLRRELGLHKPDFRSPGTPTYQPVVR